MRARQQCRRIGIDDGVPYCIHGTMGKEGLQRTYGQKWICKVAKRERNKRDKDKRLHLSLGGFLYQPRIDDPARREELEHRLRGFRAEQKRNYSEVTQVWLDQLDSPGK